MARRRSTAELLPLTEAKSYYKGANGIPKSSQKFTTDLLKKFITSRPQGTSPRSIEAYHYTLDNFIGYPITSQGITNYLNSLTCGNGKVKFYSCLRALCNWLYRNDYISVNPITKVSPPRIQKKLLPAISKEQLDILVNHVLTNRDRVILNLLWYSGMRLSEVASVKAKDFNWEEGTVIVLGKGNRYRKALAGNGVVKDWFTKYD
ncbi:tyrosine-type recombinase/integrase, partial [Chloroflexota bacterium]